ncbi:Mediator of RNA polymerase II transcription subunit 14 [Ceratocystis lukuohia]|uniref:Mediator of RNA polymerase II transcription subunit 14 n=1 Tax=Ceratocystis lukuohia TaxID=2019550 RepID=A0ABR4MNE5_9PEZI
MHNGNEAGLSEPQTKSDMPTLKDQAQDVVRESLAENSSNNNTMTLPLRGNDLPPEIMHISDGCIPLSKIITRLAQLCHNQLSDKIRQIALMPMPTPQQPSIVNGQVHSSALGQKEEFDQSNESVARKVALNQAIQKMHGKWVKTLVIADWSRRSQDVSKLIDLKSHLGQVMTEYELRLDQMINVKRDLTFARLPSPDLKTALHVLSTGDGSYLPDFQFIEPEPMTNQEMMKWIENVNTLLTIRLSLDDYDNIPVHFHDYTIRDGRVVFSVEGEFEVELTIADEDPAQQFWFVDFRFKFSPAPSEISLSLRMYLETMVNNAIAKDNLTGCYNFLHEFVLTHKINEMKRQAIELSKTSWGGVLSIETLDRAFSAQYWPNRPGPNGSKHWIIVAVDGKKKKTGWVNPKTTSNLVATWFRDGKPVKGDKVLFDTVNLSMEQLVVTVVSRHMEYIFMSIYNNLATNHIYSSREAHLSVAIDPEYPAKSSLTMQCSHEESITVIVEPTTGEFKLKSHSKASHQAELKLNKMVHPAQEGGTIMSGIRWTFLVEEMFRKSNGTGWKCLTNPLPIDDIRGVLKIRETSFWFFGLRRTEMAPSWIILCVLRAKGDEWYLCNVFTQNQPVKLDMSSLTIDLTPQFWSNLSVSIHSQIAKHSEKPDDTSTSTKQNLMHTVINYENQIAFLGASVAPRAIIASTANSGTGAGTTSPSTTSTNPEVSQGRRGPWAEDTITVIFNNVVPGPPVPSKDPHSRLRFTQTPMWYSSCIVRVLDKKKFRSLGANMSRDIRYNGRTGEFCIRIFRPLNTAIRPLLKPRLEAIDRVVNFLDAMTKAGPCVKCESVTLKRITFSYSEAGVRLDKPFIPTSANEPPPPKWTVVLDLRKSDQIAVILSDKDPHQLVGGMLTRIANQWGGLRTLIRTLPRTLAVMDAIAEIVNGSPERDALCKGVVRSLHLSAGASSLIYHLSSGTGLRLDIKARIRSGAIWWTLERVAMNGQSFTAQAGADDEEVASRLKSLFSMSDPDGRWITFGSGLTTCGVRHVKAMIKAADQKVWGL